MNEAAMPESSDNRIENVLRDQLAHGDVVLGTVGPILGHLLASNDHSLFSDEIVSRVRGMVGDIAGQLLAAAARAANDADPHGYFLRHRERLSARLLTDLSLVEHCHASALEWQLTARLEQRSAIDPVLSPLLQALIASDEGSVASVAMGALAAQARFVQHQRRMELPLGELPADLFHAVLAAWSDAAAEEEESDARVVEAAKQVRADYDESASRLGLLARLVEAMGAGSLAALSLAHGGAALFLSALSAITRQHRTLTVVATHDRQFARLALSLRAAGLKPKQIEEQFALLHPDHAPPEGLDQLRADGAAALLAGSRRAAAY